MKTNKFHETQTEDDQHVDDEKLFSPLEDLQRIEGLVPKRNSFQLSTLPKGIQIIGYMMFGCMFMLVLVVIFINIFS
ncbi:hypothetical protein ACQKP0_13355 [Heyndrickxia sp. NPDC080065]|uniref:hypothetical protein n=1 Tax=Heyndrickxia sp. NPDC080065 TaxID=3390568 RepID=UPI003D05AEB5